MPARGVRDADKASAAHQPAAVVRNMPEVMPARTASQPGERCIPIHASADVSNFLFHLAMRSAGRRSVCRVVGQGTRLLGGTVNEAAGEEPVRGLSLFGRPRTCVLLTCIPQ